MSNLEVLSKAIRDKLPHLKELKPYTEIIVPKDFSQQHFSYTIINILESNSYIDNKKTWEGDVQHKEMTQIVTVKNNAISYELERYAVKDCIYYGQPIMLNDVLLYLKVLSQEMYGETDLRLYNHFAVYFLGTWDMASPFLKDQNIVMSDRLVVLYNGVS